MQALQLSITIALESIIATRIIIHFNIALVRVPIVIESHRVTAIQDKFVVTTIQDIFVVTAIQDKFIVIANHKEPIVGVVPKLLIVIGSFHQYIIVARWALPTKPGGLSEIA